MKKPRPAFGRPRLRGLGSESEVALNRYSAVRTPVMAPGTASVQSVSASMLRTVVRNPHLPPVAFSNDHLVPAAAPVVPRFVHRWRPTPLVMAVTSPGMSRLDPLHPIVAAEVETDRDAALVFAAAPVRHPLDAPVFAAAVLVPLSIGAGMSAVAVPVLCPGGAVVALVRPGLRVDGEHAHSQERHRQEDHSFALVSGLHFKVPFSSMLSFVVRFGRTRKPCLGPWTASTTQGATGPFAGATACPLIAQVPAATRVNAISGPAHPPEVGLRPTPGRGRRSNSKKFSFAQAVLVLILRCSQQRAADDVGARNRPVRTF